MTRAAFLKKHFLDQVQPQGFEALFAHLLDVILFVKDRQGQFVTVNQAFVSMVGRKSEDEVIGRPDSDFFPPALCEKYAKDDAEVLQQGATLVDRLELVPNAYGTVDWHNTTKVPLRSLSGEILGIAGFTRDLKKMQSTTERFLVMAPVIDAIMERFAEPLTMGELAAKVNLSVSQFERQFKRRFRSTPLRYILEVRINAACQLLVETELPISEVARRTGFYDQSHFTHAFVKHKGLTPRAFRNDYLMGAKGAA